MDDTRYTGTVMSPLELLQCRELRVGARLEGQEVTDHLRGAYYLLNRRLNEIPAGSSLGRAVEPERERIDWLGNQIIASVGDYLWGRPGEAFSRLRDTLDELLAGQRLPRRDLDSSAGMVRARNVERVGLVGPRDMFHIPLNKRHLVAPQRYSIAGLPCLYLGATSHVCWYELGGQPLHKFVAARFVVARPSPVAVLDLTWNPTNLEIEVRRAPEHGEEVVVRFLRVWPLLAACSVPVRERGSPFVPEYIVPQLTVDWVARNSSLQGVAYLSNRVPEGTFPTIGTNYVFVAHSHEADTEGHFTELANLFGIGNPVAWELRGEVPRPRVDVPVGRGQHEVVASIPGLRTPYSSTAFCRFDEVLHSMGPSLLSRWTG